MENPADQSTNPTPTPRPTPPETTTNCDDFRSPEQKLPRRRFVQSTLFPLKPHDNGNKSENSGKKEGDKADEIKGVVDNVVVVDVDVDVDGDDCGGGSQSGKKKRGRKPKVNSTPPKRGRPRKVADSGKDDCLVSIDDTGTPDDGSPQKLKEKQETPTRKGRPSGNKRTSMGKTPPRQSSASQVPLIVPDLWQEAKKTAEENSRIFAGKQIHPFFSSWKAGKKEQEVIEVESYCCVDKQKESNAEFNPIHVFEDDKDIVDFNDWSNWTFFDGPFSKISCSHGTNISSDEGSAVSLNFDTGFILNSCGTSLPLKDASCRQSSGTHEQIPEVPKPVSPVVLDVEVTPLDLLQNVEKEVEESDIFISGVDERLNSDLKSQNVPQDRMMSHYLNRGNQLENSLWTNKYQPEKASEVCGNSEAVKFINDWLQLWHAANFRIRNKSRNADNFVVDDDYDSDDCDSYAENADEPSSLKNVLLVSGPVGSGKSAAIYACAKEQGFEVIEVNSSDWRNGAILKQKFGEAVGLHWLKRSQENEVGSQRKLDFSSAAFRQGAQTLDLNDDSVEMISLEKESGGGARLQTDGDDKLCIDRGEIKTLLVFEDVDVTLCEDRGLISTIQQLADTGKRPMILTSNNENLELPNNLDREEVSFTTPSSKELIDHISLVCAAEKAYVQPHLIKRCIDYCGGDIRKSMMYLQFWCQRKGSIKEVKMPNMRSPLMFNLVAMHCTLPKLIPWGLPSSLSQFIEAEVAESLCRMEKDQCLLDMLGEDEGNVRNELDSNKDEAGIIEAKKEAILQGNCFLQVDDDNIAASSLFDFSNCSDSPIAITRRSTHRKLDIVFSDSDDEFPSHEKPAVSNGLSRQVNHNSLPAVDSHFPVSSPVPKDTLHEFSDYLRNNRTTKVEEIRQRLSEETDANHINFLALGKSCDQPTGLFVHSAEADFPEIKYHSQQLLDLNSSYSEEPMNPLNQFNKELLHIREAQMQVSGNQFSLMPVVQEVFSTVGTHWNHASDQPNHFGQVMVEESKGGLAANYFMNHLSDQVQQCVQANTKVDRCLFPLTSSADPINCTIGNLTNCSTDGLSHCREANMTESQGLGIVTNMNQEKGTSTSLNPFSYPAFDVSLNSFGAQLSHSAEARGGIWNQNSEAGEQTLKCCTALGGQLNQSSGQYCSPAKAKEFQQSKAHYSGSDCINNTLCLLPDMSLKQTEYTEIGSVFHQSLKTSNFCFTGCSADGNTMTPLVEKSFDFIEAKAEEQQHQYSENTDVNHMIDRCWSVDVSCVPESTFVPETEVNDGTASRAGMDVMDIVSPMTTVDVGVSIARLDSPKVGQTGIDLNMNAGNEDTGDSQSGDEHLEASTSGCQVMDECSRMDFCKKPKRLRSSKSELKFTAQEKWNELRLADLRQHYISKHENALDILDLAVGVSNLISEGDILLNDCEFLINDSSNQDMSLSEGNFTFGWHDQQVHVASAIAEHGYCLYAKGIKALQLKMSTESTDNTLHLDWELLTSTNNPVTLGKLLRLNRSKIQVSLSNLDSEVLPVDSSTRLRETCLANIVRSMTPSRSYLALKGNALHDYLSSLAHISRSEASRLAECEAAQKTKRRRVRATKNYLSSGALDLSPDDISLLNEYNSYGKSST